MGIEGLELEKWLFHLYLTNYVLPPKNGLTALLVCVRGHLSKLLYQIDFDDELKWHSDILKIREELNEL